MSTRNYWVAINTYRSSTDNGFANTWQAHRCADAAEQRRILTEGLPVRDAEYIDNDGRRSPVSSTMGIRLLTASERRQVAKEYKIDPYSTLSL
jgi:hypothetical protein